MSNHYKEMKYISTVVGNKPDFVQGGGGNTSVKINSSKMLIKASGFFLEELDENNGFVCVKYNKILDKIKSITEISVNNENDLNIYTNNQKDDLPGFNFDKLRPSIETGFHALLKRYVVHTHSVYSNIINCSLGSRETLKDILNSEDYIFIEYHSPGLGLTIAIREALEQHIAQFNTIPVYIFLENHGLIVTSDNVEEVLNSHNAINNKIKDFFNLNLDYPEDTIEEVESNLWISGGNYLYDSIKELNLDENYFNNVILFPDQVVYFDKNVSFEYDSSKKINIYNGNVYYNVKNRKEARAINQTLLSYIYILVSIRELNLAVKSIKEDDRNYIENMESEKYRKL